ncbi:hypothetical protein T12_1123 [Trichinella patagoniensis]|uniref:Uncharacterized protein n=1 Tax=Trichinella patagoniensis TaxID=990121 RepID=A0A0V0ZC06_9BILA|nr:hypothetical protein T12_1123 [Trichinella patagoniensis]
MDDEIDCAATESARTFVVTARSTTSSSCFLSTQKLAKCDTLIDYYCPTVHARQQRIRQTEIIYFTYSPLIDCALNQKTATKLLKNCSTPFVPTITMPKCQVQQNYNHITYDQQSNDEQIEHSFFLKRFLVAVPTLTDCRFCLRCSPPFTPWASGISASKPPCLRSRISVENLLRGGSYTLNRQRRNPNQAHGCYMSESCLRW